MRPWLRAGGARWPGRVNRTRPRAAARRRSTPPGRRKARGWWRWTPTDRLSCGQPFPEDPDCPPDGVESSPAAGGDSRSATPGWTRHSWPDCHSWAAALPAAAAAAAEAPAVGTWLQTHRLTATNLGPAQTRHFQSSLPALHTRLRLKLLTKAAQPRRMSAWCGVLRCGAEADVTNTAVDRSWWHERRERLVTMRQGARRTQYCRRTSRTCPPADRSRSSFPVDVIFIWVLQFTVWRPSTPIHGTSLVRVVSPARDRWMNMAPA